MTYSQQQLAGWGNYPSESCQVSCPASRAQLVRAISDSEPSTYIARGLGRAYGDSALNANQGVLLQTGLNYFIDFDSSSGILACEAGVSLAEIIECCLPRGWFLPTTPGTKFVTVGGAIAADVHGKNHHADGSWGEFVLDFELLTASGKVVRCSRDQSADIFWATIGGMGLTGIILTARIQLQRVESAYYTVEYRRTSNLEATLDCFEQTDQRYRYSVAWIDCLASGKNLGRSVVMLANHAQRDELPAARQAHPLAVNTGRTKSVPMFFPAGALNRWSVRTFNALYYARHGDARKIVDYNTLFYPLDGVLHWNRIYGRRGFIQYQALFPHETSRRALIELLSEVADSGRASFLAVLKSAGQAGQGMLSYLFPGHTLALDLPNAPGVLELVERLDRLLLRHGGRLYLAKDATTSAATFAAMYPRLAEFQAVKTRIDPQQKFVSSQARRLGIVQS